MNEEDQKRYNSIVKKIMSSDPSDSEKLLFSAEDIKWMSDNPKYKNLINKLKSKYQILSHHKDARGTIEEILFLLDLSDRFYR